FDLFLLFSTSIYSLFFFLHDTSTTEIYTLSLHDALPISVTRNDEWIPEGFSRYGEVRYVEDVTGGAGFEEATKDLADILDVTDRSEEHTSELQSRGHLVCRLLLEKKKDK